MKITDSRTYLAEQLAPLQGAVIVAAGCAAKNPDGSTPGTGNWTPATPRLHLVLMNGQRVTVEVWCDEEGNGPGALVTTKASDPGQAIHPLRAVEKELREARATIKAQQSVLAKVLPVLMEGSRNCGHDPDSIFAVPLAAVRAILPVTKPMTANAVMKFCRASFPDVSFDETGGGIGTVFMADGRIGVGPFDFDEPGRKTSDLCVVLYDEDGNEMKSEIPTDIRDLYRIVWNYRVEIKWTPKSATKE